jgi:hypothetical protein
VFPVHSSSIHALVAALSLSLSASAFLAECRRAKAPADVCKALTHSVPHVCKALTHSVPHVCKSFVFSRAQVDTHATTTLCRIVCICRHLLMTKLQKKPDVLGTRFPRHADGPHSTTSRRATNRFVFFLPLPCASSFFLRWGQDSGTCQTLIDVAS